MKYKHWKISNIKTVDGNSELYIYALKFISSNTASTNLDKLAVHSIKEGDKSALFDFSTDTYIITDESITWWVSYEFEKPVDLLSIEVLLYQSSEYAWTSLDLECSDDGITWLKYSDNVICNIPQSTTHTKKLINLPNFCRTTNLTSTYSLRFMCTRNNFDVHDNYVHVQTYDSAQYLRGSNPYLNSVQQLNKHIGIRSNMYGAYTLNVFHGKLLVNDVNVIGIPTLSGTGSIAGNTYQNDTQTIIESEVYAIPSNINTFSKFKAMTTDGSFKLSALNTDIEYDVYAKPLTEEYNAKIASGVYPVDDIQSYKFDIYAHTEPRVFKGEEYTFKIRTYQHAGNLTYNLSGAPSGVSISADGIVTVNVSSVGDISYDVEVSDDILSVTKSYPIQMYVKDFEKYHLPLSVNGLETVSNEIWESSGNVDHIHSWARFNNGFYKANLGLHFTDDYTISATFVVYSLAQSNLGLFSSEYNPSSKRMYLYIYGRGDSSSFRYLHLYVGGTTLNLGRIREYKVYNITLTIKNNVFYAYLNNTLLYEYDINDTVRLRGAISDPFIIGSAVKTSSTYYSFNGLIKNFSILNGKSDIISDIRKSDPAEFKLVPSESMETNFYQQPLVNTTSYNAENKSITFNDSELYYEGNLLTVLYDPSDYIITVTFKVNDYGAEDEAYIAGTVDTSSKKSTGWILLAKHDRIKFETNRGFKDGYYNLAVGEVHTVKIQQVNGALFIYVNDTEVYQQNSTSADSDYTSSMLSIGNATDYNGLNGVIYDFSIKETI